eukprot:g6852.t1
MAASARFISGMLYENETGVKALCHHSIEHTKRAWEFFRTLGSPKFWIAPMVDQSELPFRMLCRKYGATGAYTPMLHAKIFSESEKYRNEEFSTCPGDRPLLAQFCANDPEYLISAGRLIQHQVDAIDLNLGCPQRIARKGRYGAFLMEDLDLVEQLVTQAVQNLSVPVTCKIRVFPEMQKTLEYVKMLERCQCSILAVHGRTRDQKDQVAIRADWEIIRLIKRELSIPVLANGNIRDLHDAYRCMEYTGADGVLSAVSLLENPSLFSPEIGAPDYRLMEDEEYHLRKSKLFMEYLDLVQIYPVKLGFVRAHLFRMLGEWLAEFVDIRTEVNTQPMRDLESYRQICVKISDRIKLTGRSYPIPHKSKEAKEDSVEVVASNDADSVHRTLNFC